MTISRTSSAASRAIPTLPTQSSSSQSEEAPMLWMPRAKPCSLPKCLTRDSLLMEAVAAGMQSRTTWGTLLQLLKPTSYLLRKNKFSLNSRPTTHKEAFSTSSLATLSAELTSTSWATSSSPRPARVSLTPLLSPSTWV